MDRFTANLYVIDWWDEADESPILDCLIIYYFIRELQSNLT